MSQSKVFVDIAELMSLKGGVRKQARNVVEKDLGIIRNAALVVEKGVVAWVGSKSKLPVHYKKHKQYSLGGKKVFPGLVDCHTHLIFAGDRTDEFEMRNQGVSYQEIARKGGGILSTVTATRKASLAKLTQLGQQRVDSHLAQGVTTIEVKSGYGLDSKSEVKMLRAANQLEKANIVTTFLGAHAVPKEIGSEKKYIEQLKKDLLQIKKQGLSQRVDIFIEDGYFSPKIARDYLQVAKDLGFDLCIHADQLSRQGATDLAVRMKAKSADHAILINKKDQSLLAASETTAVLLPIADFYLQCAYPPARSLIDQSARVAIASDYNPGSSPSQSMSLLGVLSRLEMKMSLPEVFSAMTIGAAHALGLENEIGALLPGYQADFFTSEKSWSQFFYDLSPMPVANTFVKGRKVH